jgi:hypothetical protein
LRSLTVARQRDDGDGDGNGVVASSLSLLQRSSAHRRGQLRKRRSCNTLK